MEGGLKAPKGPLSIFTEPESTKVFGIGYTTNPVDHAAMKVGVYSRTIFILYPITYFHAYTPYSHALFICFLFAQFEQHLACEIGKIQDEKRREVKRLIREREIEEYQHALMVIQVTHIYTISHLYICSPSNKPVHIVPLQCA